MSETDSAEITNKELVTDSEILKAARDLVLPYDQVVWAFDYEGVLLPKAFSTIQKVHHPGPFFTDDDLSLVDKKVNALPKNVIFLELLAQILKEHKDKSKVMKASSIELLPPHQEAQNIPVFRFGVQRSRMILEDLASQTLGSGNLLELGRNLKEGSLVVMLNDEMDNNTPPTRLYERIKSLSGVVYDSLRFCEVDLPTFRGERSPEFNAELRASLLKGFQSQPLARPVDLPSQSAVISQFGAGLASLSGGRRFRREGD